MDNKRAEKVFRVCKLIEGYLRSLIEGNRRLYKVGNRKSIEGKENYKCWVI